MTDWDEHLTEKTFKEFPGPWKTWFQNVHEIEKEQPPEEDRLGEHEIEEKDREKQGKEEGEKQKKRGKAGITT